MNYNASRGGYKITPWRQAGVGWGSCPVAKIHMICIHSLNKATSSRQLAYVP